MFLVNTKNTKLFFSKATILMLVALLFFSFKFSDWEFDKKYRTIIHKSISEIFNSDTYIIEELEEFEDAFYSVKESENIIGYFVVTKAPSKFHQFDYYIIFNAKTDILKIEILQYRENYGAEICNKRWLQQFKNINTTSIFKFNSSVDGISGATISVNSLKKDVFKLSNVLKKKIK